MSCVAEAARAERADVQDAEHAALDEQRDAEQRADALLAQDRVDDLVVVEVEDRDRPALGGDAAGEALADRDAHALLDLLLDALGGASDERAALVVEHEDRRGVGAEDVADAQQQLRQQLVDGEVGERRVGDALQRPDRLRRRLRLRARPPLLLVELGVPDRPGRPLGGYLEQPVVLRAEAARPQRGDAQDAESAVLDEQRHAEQRAVLGLGGQRPARGEDALVELVARREWRDVLVEALGGVQAQRGGLVVGQQDRGAVGSQDLRMRSSSSVSSARARGA